MDTEKHYLSQGKVEELRKESEELKMVKRREIAERLEFAKSLGDLSENAAYHEAKESQAFLEGQILELQEAIHNSVVISGAKNKDVVDIGSTVEIEKDNEKLRFQIVGAHESNPSEGKISNESPLGKALLNRKRGEIIEVETPTGKIKYKIRKID